MTHGIQEDPKRRTGLKIRFGCPQGECVCFASVEIRDRKIHMQLLGHWSFGPCRRDVALDFLERECWSTLIEQFDPRHVLSWEIAQRFNVESREL